MEKLREAYEYKFAYGNLSFCNINFKKILNRFLEAGWTGLFSSQYSATAYNNFADVAVKGTLPLSDLFSLYVRLGGGINNTGSSGTATGSGSNCLCNDSGGTNFAWLGGLGGSFALSRNIDLRIEDYMIMPMGGSSNYGNINNLMGGVQYNF